MAVRAVVREWHATEGWGVVVAPQTPSGCWVHFSHLAVPGYRELVPGQEVALEWEAAEQDGHAYRAVRVWPWGEEPAEPSDPAGPAAPTVRADRTAFRSTLTLSLEPAPDDRPHDLDAG